MIGLSTTFTIQCLSMFILGISSGLYIVGYSFVSYADKEERDKVVIAISVASVCGTLTGPFLGSALYSIVPDPWPLYTFGFLGATMLVLTVLFLYVFRDVDSSKLLAPSDYGQLERDLVDREEDKRELEEIGADTERELKLKKTG